MLACVNHVYIWRSRPIKICYVHTCHVHVIGHRPISYPHQFHVQRGDSSPLPILQRWLINLRTWCQIIVCSIYICIVYILLCVNIYNLFGKQYSSISQRTPTDNLSAAPTILTINIWLLSTSAYIVYNIVEVPIKYMYNEIKNTNIPWTCSCIWLYML